MPRFLRLLLPVLALMLLACTSEATTPPPPEPRTAVAPDSIPAAQAEVAAVVPAFTICLDPGHSVEEPNIHAYVPQADGSIELVPESAITLDVSLHVAALLRERYAAAAPPVEVMLTWGEDDGRSRPWDVLAGPPDDLEPTVKARGAFCTAQGADLVTSIHANAKIPTDELTDFDGLLIAYRDANDEAFAEAIHFPLLDALGVDGEGVPLETYTNFGLDPGNWWISEGAIRPNVPAVVIEPVFMTDQWEGPRLFASIAEAPDGRRAQIAEALSDAIGDYVDTLLTPEAAAMSGDDGGELDN